MNRSMLIRSTMKANARLQSVFLALTVLATLGFVAGCSSCKPGKDPGPATKYNIKVLPGDSLKDSSLTVDIIGVRQSELQLLQNYSLKKYWKPDDPVRKDLSKVSVPFLPGNQTPFVLGKTNVIWQKWVASGVQYVVVIADLPGIYEEGKAGSQDPRRQLIPICKCYWPSSAKELDVEVRAGGVRVVTIPREGQTLPVW
jgi:hypothetical protein